MAAPVCGRSLNRRPSRAAWQHDVPHRRRDAGALCVSAESQLLDPVAARTVRIRTTERAGGKHLRPASSWSHAGQRASGADGAWPARLGCVASTHEHLRPRVMPYTYAYNVMDDPQNALALHAIQLAILLLLVVICVNVA